MRKPKDWVATPIGVPFVREGYSLVFEKAIAPDGKVHYGIGKKTPDGTFRGGAFVPVEDIEAMFAWLRMPKTLTIEKAKAVAPKATAPEFNPFL